MDYEILRQGNEKWNKCKLLGSFLDAEKHTNRRKMIAIDDLKTLKNIMERK